MCSMKAIQRWFPLTPSTYARDIAKIFALSALVQSFFFLTAYYCVPGGALEFVAFGKALTSLLRGHLEFVPEAADRSVGFPFLLVLSGFYQNGSLIGITVIHGLMAMLMPILIYLTVVPISFCRGLLRRASLNYLIRSIFICQMAVSRSVLHILQYCRTLDVWQICQYWKNVRLILANTCRDRNLIRSSCGCSVISSPNCSGIYHCKRTIEIDI